MASLKHILRAVGKYYLPGDFFYHRLLYWHFRGLGFRVIRIDRMAEHPVWHIRLRITLTAQMSLLVSRARARRQKKEDPGRDILTEQLSAETKAICKLYGPPLKADSISVVREGAYFSIPMVWNIGKPGFWTPKKKTDHAFNFKIRPWLKENKN